MVPLTWFGVLGCLAYATAVVISAAIEAGAVAHLRPAAVVTTIRPTPARRPVGAAEWLRSFLVLVRDGAAPAHTS